MKTALYFAYGSNLDEQQMRTRCPTATRGALARLPRHELVFGGFSHRWNGAVASVRRSASSEVHGLLYQIDPEALRLLDGFEGHPFSYQRVIRRVIDADGHERSTYLYRQPLNDFQASAPSLAYFSVIERAYQRLGLDPRLLARAAGHEGARS